MLNTYVLLEKKAILGKKAELKNQYPELGVITSTCPHHLKVSIFACSVGLLSMCQLLHVDKTSPTYGGQCPHNTAGTVVLPGKLCNHWP